MDARVFALFSTHQNPKTKISLVQKKYFLPNEESANEEAEVVKIGLTNLYVTLNSERVDKRNARSKGELIIDTDIVRIIKTVGLNLNYMGFSSDNRKCLNRQEVMFLLETNRMEVYHKDVPLSLQNCYNIFLDSNLSLSSYRVYRKLAIDGFKLTLFKNWSLRNKCENRMFKRMKCDNVPERSKKSSENCNMVSIFNRLRQNAPKEAVETLNFDCDYKMNYPNNSKNELNMDIYVNTSTNFDSKYGFSNNKMLCGIVTPNNIAFYRIVKVKIPTL